MKTIEVVKLLNINVQTIEVPAGSKILGLREREDGVYLIYEGDPGKKSSPVTVLTFQTGCMILTKLIKGAKYLGTVSGYDTGNEIIPELHIYYKQYKTKSA